MTPPSAVDLGTGFVDEAQADPAGYRSRARDLLARFADDPATTVHVRWALGLALRELGELPRARDELEAAAAAAAATGAERTAALVRSSLAVVLLHLGETQAALAATDAAARDLDGAEAARNQMQRGLILHRLGRQDDALAAYVGAQPELRAAGDRPAEARLLSNRGVLHAYRGELGAAQADLERSVQLARGIGNVRAVALGLQNLGFVAGRQGRLPEALALLEEADGLLAELDDAPALAVLDADRAEVLADAGLFEEAIQRAEASARALSGDAMNGAEAELLVARLCLVAGHDARAEELADRVRDRFRGTGREGWELQARYVALAARANRAASVDVAATDRLADDLEAGGWATEARVARLVAARQVLSAGMPDTAHHILERVRGVSPGAPALARAQHWYATALVRLGTGDRRGAKRAVAAGLDVLDRSRLVFGSAELRAHAAAHTTDLVRLAVRMALEDGQPAEALRSLDRVRATDVGVPHRPHDDPQIAADLAELRRLDEESRDAARAGQDVGPILAGRARVERRVQDRARAVVHDGGDAVGLRLQLPALRRALGGRTLAAYLELDGILHVVAVTPRATRHHRLGPVDEVRTCVQHLRAAVRRLAYGHGTAASLAAAQASSARSADQLVGALGLDRLDPDGLVVVPTGVLADVPWAALAPFLGHVPVVAPSAGGWLAATTRAPRTGGTLLAAGPGLPGAVAEVSALASTRPDATVLTGADASVAAVVAGMQEASTFHLAAHGLFRTDNPLFSWLRLADGPLTVYELEGLPRLPGLVVLSSCEGAATASLRGDAVLGLSSVLLRLGVSCVVAPVVEVPDDAAAALMIGFHAALAGGASPQRALTHAIAAAPDDGPAAAAVRASFVVVGASLASSG